jgi:hypothetical protein
LRLEIEMKFSSPDSKVETSTETSAGARILAPDSLKLIEIDDRIIRDDDGDDDDDDREHPQIDFVDRCFAHQKVNGLLSSA